MCPNLQKLALPSKIPCYAPVETNHLTCITDQWTGLQWHESLPKETLKQKITKANTSLDTGDILIAYKTFRRHLWCQYVIWTPFVLSIYLRIQFDKKTVPKLSSVKTRKKSIDLLALQLNRLVSVRVFTNRYFWKDLNPNKLFW